MSNCQDYSIGWGNNRSRGHGHLQKSSCPFKRGHPERWPSGLRRTLGKRVCGKPYRGFESHSLRHSYRQPDFSINEKVENLPIKGGFSRVATVLEIAERRHFRLGDGIFLQSFV